MFKFIMAAMNHVTGIFSDVLLISQRGVRVMDTSQSKHVTHFMKQISAFKCLSLAYVPAE
jgi:hypothetical protein